MCMHNVLNNRAIEGKYDLLLKGLMKYAFYFASISKSFINGC